MKIKHFIPKLSPFRRSLLTFGIYHLERSCFIISHTLNIIPESLSVKEVNVLDKIEN